MASASILAVTNVDEEEEAKQARPRRTRPLPRLVRKICKLATQYQGTAKKIRELAARYQETAREMGELAAQNEETAREISELAMQSEETARLETERDRKDDGRLRGILNAESGGAMERILRNVNLSEPDKDFLREKRWRV